MTVVKNRCYNKILISVTFYCRCRVTNTYKHMSLVYDARLVKACRNIHWKTKLQTWQYKQYKMMWNFLYHVYFINTYNLFCERDYSLKLNYNNNLKRFVVLVFVFVSWNYHNCYNYWFKIPVLECLGLIIKRYLLQKYFKQKRKTNKLD